MTLMFAHCYGSVFASTKMGGWIGKSSHDPLLLRNAIGTSEREVDEHDRGAKEGRGLCIAIAKTDYISVWQNADVHTRCFSV